MELRGRDFEETLFPLVAGIGFGTANAINVLIHKECCILNSIALFEFLPGFVEGSKNCSADHLLLRRCSRGKLYRAVNYL